MTFEELLKHLRDNANIFITDSKGGLWRHNTEHKIFNYPDRFLKCKVKRIDGTSNFIGVTLITEACPKCGAELKMRVSEDCLCCPMCGERSYKWRNNAQDNDN